MRMKQLKNSILLSFLILVLHSCASLEMVNMTSSKMNKLELGMSKQQVTQILGSAYTISEKRVEDNSEIEVISYRDSFELDEIYFFVFKNKKLDNWYRDLISKEIIETK